MMADDGRVIGYGSSGIPRPDVPAQLPNVRALYVGWVGYANTVGTTALKVYGQAGDANLCLVASKELPLQPKP
jgi:hypothetical protein